MNIVFIFFVGLKMVESVHSNEEIKINDSFYGMVEDNLKKYKKKYMGGGALPLQCLEIKDGNVEKFIGEIIKEIKDKKDNISTDKEFFGFSKAVIKLYNDVIYGAYDNALHGGDYLISTAGNDLLPTAGNDLLPTAGNDLLPASGDGYINYSSFDDYDFHVSYVKKSTNSEMDGPDSQIKESIKNLHDTIINFLIEKLNNYEKEYFENGGKIDLGNIKIRSREELNEAKSYLNGKINGDLDMINLEPIKWPSGFNVIICASKDLLRNLASSFKRWTQTISNLMGEINKTFKFDKSKEIEKTTEWIDNSFLEQLGESIQHFEEKLGKITPKVGQVTAQRLKRIIEHKKELKSSNGIAEYLNYVASKVKYTNEADKLADPKYRDESSQNFKKNLFGPTILEFYQTIIRIREDIKEKLNNNYTFNSISNLELKKINQKGFEQSLISDKNFSNMMLNLCLNLNEYMRTKIDDESSFKNENSLYKNLGIDTYGDFQDFVCYCDIKSEALQNCKKIKDLYIPMILRYANNIGDGGEIYLKDLIINIKTNLESGNLEVGSYKFESQDELANEIVRLNNIIEKIQDDKGCISNLVSLQDGENSARSYLNSSIHSNKIDKRIKELYVNIAGNINSFTFNNDK